jgi:DNA (cytosine-5)-methyltransferase 1
MHLVYKKIGRNKGVPRLWFQGRRLSRCNLKPGSRIEIEYCEDQIRIFLSDSGNRVVSQKKEDPIIDINNARIDEVFQGASRIRAVINPGEIVITIHPDEKMQRERLERLLDKISNSEPLSVGSVAHGGGIMDHAIHQGLKDLGVKAKLAFAVEIDEGYLETSLRNNDIWDLDSMSIEAPMQEVEPTLLPKVDIFVGGIPCTGASVAGRSKNKLSCAEEHSSAGSLFFAFLNILKTVNPSCVVLENVVPYQNTASMTVIRSVLSGWGYQVQETVIGGNEFGALEDRQRLCMVAMTQGLDYCLDTLCPVTEKEPSLGAILEDIPLDNPMWREFEYLRNKEARDVAAGKGFKMQIVDGSAQKVGTIGRSYAKCRQTEPFVKHPFEQRKMRILTPKEHAAVKTIPLELVNGCSNTQAHEILGQSVIHAAFVALGRFVGRIFKNLESFSHGHLLEQPASETSVTPVQLALNF